MDSKRYLFFPRLCIGGGASKKADLKELILFVFIYLLYGIHSLLEYIIVEPNMNFIGWEVAC